MNKHDAYFPNLCSFICWSFQDIRKVSTDKKMGNPKGDKIGDGAMYCSKVSSPQKKELKFMPLGSTSQNMFSLEQ
jgi:hypothetical protein